MSALAAASGGFLLAVLWFDLMFDVQVLRHPSGDLPEAVLASIAGYYRRVTTDARRMSYAVRVAMLVAVVGALRQFASGAVIGIASLAACAVPIALAVRRVVPNAVRLGTRRDPPAVQTELARGICRDHFVCLACIAAFVGLQVVAAPH